MGSNIVGQMLRMLLFILLLLNQAIYSMDEKKIPLLSHNNKKDGKIEESTVKIEMADQLNDEENKINYNDDKKDKNFTQLELFNDNIEPNTGDYNNKLNDFDNENQNEKTTCQNCLSEYTPHDVGRIVDLPKFLFWPCSPYNPNLAISHCKIDLKCEEEDKHIFCQDCVETLVKTKKLCPTCGKKIELTDELDFTKVVSWIYQFDNGVLQSLIAQNTLALIAYYRYRFWYLDYFFFLSFIFQKGMYLSSSSVGTGSHAISNGQRRREVFRLPKKCKEFLMKSYPKTNFRLLNLKTNFTRNLFLLILQYFITQPNPPHASVPSEFFWTGLLSYNCLYTLVNKYTHPHFMIYLLFLWWIEMLTVYTLFESHHK